MKGLAVDLVIWNEEHAVTATTAGPDHGLIASGIEASVIDRRRHLRPGGGADPQRGPRPAAVVARAVITDGRERWPSSSTIVAWPNHARPVHAEPNASTEAASDTTPGDDLPRRELICSTAGRFHP